MGRRCLLRHVHVGSVSSAFCPSRALKDGGRTGDLRSAPGALCLVLAVAASAANAYGGNVCAVMGPWGSNPWLSQQIVADSAGYDIYGNGSAASMQQIVPACPGWRSVARMAAMDDAPANDESFREHFDSLDNWTVNENGGNVDISDGLSLSTSGTPAKFPYLVLNLNPFPTDSNLILRVGMQFTSINPYGDGLVVTGSEGNTIWWYWADSFANCAGMDTDYHTLEWDYSNGLQAFLVDGVAQDTTDNLHVSNSSTRPTGIWLGNPVTVPGAWPWTSFVVYYIEVDGIDSAVASPATIEPALGDTTTITWSTTDSTAQSIVIIDSSGAAIDSVGIDLGTPDSSGTYSGSVTWPSYENGWPPIGHYTIGFGLTDDTIDPTGGTITVKPTVYNVYSASGPDDEPEIHYTISADVTSCGVQVGTDSGIITGPTSGGTDEHVTWNGIADSSNGCPPAGTYPVTITTEPQACPNLLLTTDSQEYSMLSSRYACRNSHDPGASCQATSSVGQADSHDLRFRRQPGEVLVERRQHESR